MSVVSSPRRQKTWQIAAEVVSLLDVMEEKRRSLGERLRALSRAQGLESDEDAARFLKMSYRQYQRWLAGDSEPRVSSLKRVAERYGVPLTDLVDLPQPEPGQLDRIEARLEAIEKLLNPAAALTPAEKADQVSAEVEEESRPRARRRRT